MSLFEHDFIEIPKNAYPDQHQESSKSDHKESYMLQWNVKSALPSSTSTTTFVPPVHLRWGSDHSVNTLLTTGKRHPPSYLECPCQCHHQCQCTRQCFRKTCAGKFLTNDLHDRKKPQRRQDNNTRTTEKGGSGAGTSISRYT